jgi:hypothetical protein
MSMPLDGSYLANEPYRVIEIPARPTSVARPRRRKISWFQIFVVMFALWVVAWNSEVFSHDRGIFTLVFGGPIQRQESDIARSILYGPDAHKLEFVVAGRHYKVISPGHRLTSAEQTALLNYAARNKFPMWTADGQFAVDP